MVWRGDRSVQVTRYFDYQADADEAGISSEELAALRRRVEADYASQMLRELHLHSICKAIAAGEKTVADALKPNSNTMPPISELRLGG